MRFEKKLRRSQRKRLFTVPSTVARKRNLVECRMLSIYGGTLASMNNEAGVPRHTEEKDLNFDTRWLVLNLPQVEIVLKSTQRQRALSRHTLAFHDDEPSSRPLPLCGPSSGRRHSRKKRIIDTSNSCRGISRVSGIAAFFKTLDPSSPAARTRICCLCCFNGFALLPSS